MALCIEISCNEYADRKSYYGPLPGALCLWSEHVEYSMTKSNMLAMFVTQLQGDILGRQSMVKSDPQKWGAAAAEHQADDSFYRSLHNQEAPRTPTKRQA